MGVLPAASDRAARLDWMALPAETIEPVPIAN